MESRSSLPPIEHFSRNPRTIRDQNPIPFLSLLNISNSNDIRLHSARSSRAKSQRSLPSLSKIPGLAPEHNFSLPSAKGSRAASSKTQRTFDDSLIKPLPGAPLTPSEVLKIFSSQLVPLEIDEITNFTEIYYIGDLEYKPFEASYDSDYDDHKKQYHAIANDHIKYRYQIISYAGGGTFSSVYRCFDHKLGIPVAVKVIRSKPDCLQNAEIEAKIQSQIHGKHSVKLIESFSFRGHYCLSLELLYTNILQIAESKRYQQLPPDTVRHITFQMLLSLREMASKGIVHADIKPENILTNDDSLLNTKIADFGTACFTEDQKYPYIQSRYYRAPEVLYGMKYGPQIDMWSLGCVVFELISGQILYSAHDEEELTKMHILSIGSPPPEVYKNSKKWNQYQSLFNTLDNENEFERTSSDDNLQYNFRFSDNIATPSYYEYGDIYEEDGEDEWRRTQHLSVMLTYLPRHAAQFVKACLVWDPAKRMTPEEALQSDWMKEEIDYLISKRKKLEKEKESQEKSETIKKGPNNMIRKLGSQKKYAVREPQTARLTSRPHGRY